MHPFFCTEDFLLSFLNFVSVPTLITCFSPNLIYAFSFVNIIDKASYMWWKRYETEKDGSHELWKAHVQLLVSCTQSVILLQKIKDTPWFKNTLPETKFLPHWRKCGQATVDFFTMFCAFVTLYFGLMEANWNFFFMVLALSKCWTIWD